MNVEPQPDTANTNSPLFVNLFDADEEQGFVRTPPYLPSRHLRAAQAALNSAKVYKTTSKQERANKKTTNQKITAQEVEDFLKAEGLIDENAVISDNFEDPYTDLDKWRMHDTWRTDHTTKRALEVLAEFTLGQRTINTLDVNAQEKPKPDDQKKMLDTITNNPTYQQYVYQLDCIDRDVDFDYVITAAFIQSKVFGRACVLIQDDPDTGLPVALKLISPMRLGRVFVDEVTWKIVAVEYLDYVGTDSIIPQKNMIYIRNEDYAISPNVYGFGYSSLEPILDIAETNRQLTSVAIKEINKSQWAPYLIVAVNSKRKSQLDKIAASFKPGLPFVHNQPITSIQTVEMHNDLAEILHEINENSTDISTCIGIPNFLMGKEDVTNRATTATVVDSWSKSKLEKQRTLLRGVIEPQWNDRNLEIIIKNGLVEGQDMMMKYNDPSTGKPTIGNLNPSKALSFPGVNNGGNGKNRNKTTSAANAAAFPPMAGPGYDNQPQNPQTNAPDDQTTPLRAIPPDTPVNKLEFKIKREFKPIVLDTIFETAQPVATLIQNKVIDTTKARDIYGFQDIEARMKEQEEQNKLQMQQSLAGLNPFQQMKGAENKAMSSKNQKPGQSPAGTGGGGIKQVGESVQAPSLSSSQGSYLESTHTAVEAATKLRMQVDKRRLELYDVIEQAVQDIAMK